MMASNDLRRARRALKQIVLIVRECVCECVREFVRMVVRLNVRLDVTNCIATRQPPFGCRGGAGAVLRTESELVMT